MACKAICSGAVMALLKMVTRSFDYFPPPKQDDFPLRDPNIDFPATIYGTLKSIVEESYDHIVTEYTESK